MTKMSTSRFIEKSKMIHGDKYDYSETDMNDKNKNGKVKIICPIHGEFWMLPSKHIKGGNCPKCAHRSYKYTTNEFVAKIKEKYGDKYDYSNVNYINSRTPIILYCKKHNYKFSILPTNLLKGEKCKFCANEERSNKLSLTTDEFIKKSKEKFGNKYDYSKTVYVKSNQKLIITCPIHGDFKITPNNNLAGEGCPICKESHLEGRIRQVLLENNIKFIYQYKTDWLGLQSLDFYLPDYKSAIECQGEQHFKSFRFEKNEKPLNVRKERDRIKLNKCKRNGVKLIYFSDKQYNDSIITNEQTLVKIIKGEN